MYEHLRRFGSWFIALSGLAAAYITAREVEALSLFWIVFAGALLATVGKPTLRRAVEWITRVRNYPLVLSRVAKLQESLESVKIALQESEQRTKFIAARMMEVGRQQVIGAMQAQMSAPHVPILRSVTRTDEDGLILLGVQPEGESANIGIGARYSLFVQGTRTSLGAIEVTAAEDDSVIEMRCVERLKGEFWDRLEERAGSDPSPPTGIEIRPYALDDADHNVIADVLHSQLTKTKDDDDA